MNRQQALLDALNNLRCSALQELCRDGDPNKEYEALGLTLDQWNGCYATGVGAKQKMLDAIAVESSYDHNAVPSLPASEPFTPSPQSPLPPPPAKTNTRTTKTTRIAPSSVKYKVELRDGTVEAFSESQFMPNPAFDFLKSHPKATRKECWDKHVHDTTTCDYIHLVHRRGRSQSAAPRGHSASRRSASRGPRRSASRGREKRSTSTSRPRATSSTTSRNATRDALDDQRFFLVRTRDDNTVQRIDAADFVFNPAYVSCFNAPSTTIFQECRKPRIHNVAFCHNVHPIRYCVRFAREGIDAMLLPTELVENVALQKLRSGAFTKREECQLGPLCANKRACTYCHLKTDEEDEDEKAMERLGWSSLQQQQQQATTMSPPAPVASSKVILNKVTTRDDDLHLVHRRGRSQSVAPRGPSASRRSASRRREKRSASTSRPRATSSTSSRNATRDALDDQRFFLVRTCDDNTVQRIQAADFVFNPAFLACFDAPPATIFQECGNTKTHYQQTCPSVHVRRYCVRTNRGLEMLLPTELVENVALQNLRSGAFTKREECQLGPRCSDQRLCTYCHFKVTGEQAEEKVSPSVQQQQQQVPSMQKDLQLVASYKFILKKPTPATTPSPTIATVTSNNTNINPPPSAKPSQPKPTAPAAPAAVVPNSAAEQFFGIVVDGYCFIKCYGWSVAVLKQLVAEVSAGLRSRGARAAVHSHGRVFLFPDPSDALTKKLITNENLLATIEQLNAIRKDGWQVVHTSFKLVGALWKATAEDVAFANECAKLCRASALDPVGADPSRVTLSHLVIVTGDNDHVTTFTTQSNHELRWLVDMSPSADPNVPLRRHARDMQRLLTFSASLGKGVKGVLNENDKPKNALASPAASVTQPVDNSTSALFTAAKNKGNASLSKGEYGVALKHYDEALMHLKDVPDTPQRAKDMSVIHCHKAECFLKKSLAGEAHQSAVAALKHNAKNAEAERFKKEAEEILRIEKKASTTTRGRAPLRSDVRDDTPVVDAALLLSDAELRDSPAERLKAAVALKEKGNLMFTRGNYEAAMEKYDEALDVLNAFGRGLPEHFKEIAVIFSNAAQACIKLEDWGDAFSYVMKAVHYDPHNEKSIMRAAAIQAQLGSAAPWLAAATEEQRKRLIVERDSWYGTMFIIPK